MFDVVAGAVGSRAAPSRTASVRRMREPQVRRSTGAPSASRRLHRRDRRARAETRDSVSSGCRPLRGRARRAHRRGDLPMRRRRQRGPTACTGARPSARPPSRATSSCPHRARRGVRSGCALRPAAAASLDQSGRGRRGRCMPGPPRPWRSSAATRGAEGVEERVRGHGGSSVISVETERGTQIFSCCEDLQIDRHVPSKPVSALS